MIQPVNPNNIDPIASSIFSAEPTVKILKNALVITTLVALILVPVTPHLVHYLGIRHIVTLIVFGLQLVCSMTALDILLGLAHYYKFMPDWYYGCFPFYQAEC